MTTTTDSTTAHNLSAACGAWKNHNGTHAHDLCDGEIALPAPLDRCTCSCHTQPAPRVLATHKARRAALGFDWEPGL
jgi:hypothetical protein